MSRARLPKSKTLPYLPLDSRVRNFSHASYKVAIMQVTSESGSQWKGLTRWVETNELGLRSILAEVTSRKVLYGEWLYARHSVAYDKLPAYFVAFDVWDDGEQAFLSRNSFHALLKETGIPVVSASNSHETV